MPCDHRIRSDIPAWGRETENYKGMKKVKAANKSMTKLRFQLAVKPVEESIVPMFILLSHPNLEIV